MTRKFKGPSVKTICSRTATITNAFGNAIMPVVEPSDAEIEAVLDGIGQGGKTIDKQSCVYCSEKATEWDHLNPMIRDKKPTGYFSEIWNLVPACGTCNQSKGARDWADWIGSDAPKSPKVQGKPWEENRRRLDGYLRSRPQRATCIDIKAIVEADRLQAYEDLRQNILKLMKAADEIAAELRSQIVLKANRLMEEADEIAAEMPGHIVYEPNRAARLAPGRAQAHTGTPVPLTDATTLPIGHRVRSVLQHLAGHNHLTDDHLEVLTSKEKSHAAFKASFAVLIDVTGMSKPARMAASRDDGGRLRYYSTFELAYRQRIYALSAQWFEHQRPLFEAWVWTVAQPG